MVAMVSTQERQDQRYNHNGHRLIVGCIPYRIKMDKQSEQVEVLVITSQKGHGMMFPKGGWELGETMKEGACREVVEEAGVQGDVEYLLGKWGYKSKRHDIFHEAFMFSLKVTEELVQWPEMVSRNRKWATIEEARQGCQNAWMKEALETLVLLLSILRKC
ncbi:putative hydrolase [Dioscorea sansibarensis]